jgi:hypothetical protein
MPTAKKTSTAKKPAAAKKAKKGPDKKAIARAATVRENQVHIQTEENLLIQNQTKLILQLELN